MSDRRSAILVSPAAMLMMATTHHLEIENDSMTIYVEFYEI
jgi:hypothetical protein